MNSNLTPVTLDLPDELIAELTLTTQAKKLTLEEWVTILVKKRSVNCPTISRHNPAKARFWKKQPGR